MSKEEKIVRPCRDCPEWTHTVCCFAFGKFWRDKSRNGEGCAHPVDGVAESWRKAGWKPGGKPRADISFLLDAKTEKLMPRVVKRQCEQKSLFAPSMQKPAEPPPLTDDDY